MMGFVTRDFAPSKVLFAAAALGATLTVSTASRADITYVVQRGHTLAAIAHRYHVTVQSLRDANHSTLSPLTPGQRLVIPGVEERPGHGGGRAERQADHQAHVDDPGQPEADEGRGNPNIIHARCQGEEVRIRLRDGRSTHGKLRPQALKTFERMMRQGDATHPPDPRLLAIVGIVAAHFDNKPIEVVSGYRPYKPTQYAAHSNHNLGRALDFRIEGVPNEALRDFCRTLRNTGCGYYPNSTFVHVDVRDAKAYWVDLSRPGEAPQYEHPGMTGDEGIGDVVPTDPP